MANNVSWQFTATATTNTLIVVEVVNETVIWAAGGGFAGAANDGSVLRSVDGGQNWENVSPPGGVGQAFRDVKAFDADRALVLAVGNGPLSRVWLTDNGGRRWERVFQNTVHDAFYDGMTFFDDSRGLAVSDAVDGAFPILATVDGGETWELVSSAGVPAALPGETVFATGTTLVTVGESDAWFGTTATNRSPRVFHTGDSGKTWVVADTPIPASPDDRAGLRSLSFLPDRLHGLAVSGTPPGADGTGAVGFTARTSDGGLTWGLAGPTTGFRNSVAWISSQAAVAVGLDGSDLSADAGDTWTQFDPTSMWGVHGRTLEDDEPLLCWAVGDGGRAARLVRQ
jgi:photosystem II stability/assembly factor-like uncharacterized protein